MNYEVARDGQNIGIFSEEELIEAIEEGRVLLDDDAWTEGMEDWEPVATLVEEDDEGVSTDGDDAEEPQITKPVIVPLGRRTSAGHAATTHYAPQQPAPVPAPPAPVPTPQPATFSPAYVRGAFPPTPGRYGTPGAAIASLVLGILSFALLVFTSIPAIVCGHVALGKIKRSSGAYRGEGVAIAGLVLGYVMTVFSLPIAFFLLKLSKH